MHGVPDLNYSTPNRPDFLILGVQKSATTTLFDVLNSLDGFSGSSLKELHFFDNNYNYQKGSEWYLTHFDGKVGSKRFEATPSYIYSRYAPERIYNEFGPMKFVVVLRDPVKRCFSAWNMFRVFNSNKQTAAFIYETYIKDSNSDSREALRELLFAEEFPTFERCVEDDMLRHKTKDLNEEPSFVRRGFYYDQIQRFLEFYSIRDFLFLEQEEFSKNTLQNVKQVCDFLEVELSTQAECVQKISNKGDYEGVAMEAHAEVFLKLYNLYREPNEKLFSLIDKDYPWSASWLSL